MTRPADLLAVIDMQPAFSHADSPWFTPGLAEAAPRISRLVDAFGSRAVFTRFVPPSEPFGSWLDYYRHWPFALSPASAWLWELDAPWQDRPSLASHTFGKWLPDLHGRLPPGGAAVLCGVSTDCCVFMTALAAVDAGVPVRVVADACAAKTPEIHRRALDFLATRAPQLEVTTLAAELARQERAG